MGIVGTVDNHVPEAVNKHRKISSGKEWSENSVSKTWYVEHCLLCLPKQHEPSFRLAGMPNKMDSMV